MIRGLFDVLFAAGILCLTGMPLMAAGDEAKDSPVHENYPVYLRFPLVDFPFVSHAPHDVPSMTQSLQLSQSAIMAAHGLLSTAMQSRAEPHESLWEFSAILGVDFLFEMLPLGSTWVHEEWHRAVLGQYGLRSHNGVYNFDFASGDVPVDQVRDEDLIKIKTEHPADFVRLSSAGMEAESEMALAFERDIFFRDVLRRQQLEILLNHWRPLEYRDYCTQKAQDEDTDQSNLDEANSIRGRDFTGYDCTAWVYDMFRPDEPYIQRGTHPYGIGINRYRKLSDLTAAELKYLKRMASMGFINLIDPFILGLNGFSTPMGLWNLTMRHHLTPFGYSLESNLFFRGDTLRTLVILRQYANHHQTRPGVQVEFIDLNLPPIMAGLQSDLWVAYWMQPHHLRFDESRWDNGGLWGLRLHLPVAPGVQSSLEVEQKSAGWAAGRVALGAEVSAKIGLTMKI